MQPQLTQALQFLLIKHVTENRRTH